MAFSRNVHKHLLYLIYILLWYINVPVNHSVISYDLTDRSGRKKYRKYEKNCLFHRIE